MNTRISKNKDEFFDRAQDKWRKRLAPLQYHIMREKGTEPPFSGKYWDSHEKGMYKCAACETQLFSSDTKFDSGTGWPSFTKPANRENIDLKEDFSHGMRRIEVLCKQCGSHLGHVFDDLPRGKAGLSRRPRWLNEVGRRGKSSGLKEKGGKRYCINSACLSFEKGE